MKQSTIGSQKIFKDIKSIGLIETGLPKITYPMSFSNLFFLIEQEYVCDANQVPTFTHGVAHSKYPASKSITQSSASILSPGLAKFTRKFAQFPSTEIQEPSTSSVTYPIIANGLNYSGRGIQTIEEQYQVPSNLIDEDGNPVMITQTRNVSAITSYFRRFSVSKVIPVLVRTSFVYLGSTYKNNLVSPSGVSAGTIINGKIVSSNIFDGERWNVIFEDGSITSFSNTGYVQTQIPIYNLQAIELDEPFKIIDGYSGYEGAEVSFVDNFTSPTKTEFLSQINTEKLLFSSQIEHIGGYLYMKKNIYGKIQ